MKIFLRIVFLDGTEKTVCAVAPEIVAWETKFDKSIAVLSKSFKVTDLLFLAWHFENRTKATDKDFDTWILEVDLVELGSADPK